MSDIEKLVSALDEMFSKVKPVNGYFVNSYCDEKDQSTEEEIKLVDSVDCLCGCLIKNGGIDYANEKILNSNGYSVIVLERDSFGPLSCGIIKGSRANGIFVFY